MPNLDGTGPLGQGPMTGRKRGRCIDNRTMQNEKVEEKNIQSNDYIYGFGYGGRRRSRGGIRNRFGGGFGQGFGRGQGRGCGRGFGNQ
jgi:hypothetical protein